MAAPLGLLAVSGGFFYVRNLIWTGSPFAPLFLPDAPKIANFRGGGAFSGWLELLRGADIFDPAISDESLGILLPLAFLAGLFALASKDRIARTLAVIGIIQMPILLTIAPGSRNQINGFVPLAIAGAALIVHVWRESAKPIRIALGAAASVALFAQLVLVAFTLESYDLMPYLAGKETAAQYIARTRRFAAPYAWLAQSTPPNARILLLGETRTFYLDRRALSGGNLDGPRVASWLSRMQLEGITHVVIHRPWYRLAGAAPTTALEREYVLEVPPATHRALTELLNTRSRLRYRDGEYLIYELTR